MAEESDDDQKTEEPSQKRLDDAREKGQFASSREVNHLFMLLGGSIIVVMMAPTVMTRIATALVKFLDYPDELAQAGRFGELLSSTAREVGGALVGPLILLVVFALISGIIQHGMSFSIEPVIPKLEKNRRVPASNGFFRCSRSPSCSKAWSSW